MTKDQLIWLAGFIDGEGYFGIIPKNNRYQCHLRIATTHKSTMQYVSMLLEAPINFHRSSKPKENWKDNYSVSLYDKKVEGLIVAILPYLVTKRWQAEGILEYRKTIKSGRNQYSSTTDQEKKKQDEIYSLMRFINKRGKD